MKKVLMIFGLVMYCGVSYGGAVCATTDDVVVVLDPAVNGTSRTFNAAEMTWRATFSYGTITGIASCNTIKGSSTGAINTTDTMSQSDTGQYCWCKMLSPAGSVWTFEYDRESASKCAKYCASYCGDRAQISSAWRGGAFRAAGI